MKPTNDFDGLFDAMFNDRISLNADKAKELVEKSPCTFVYCCRAVLSTLPDFDATQGGYVFIAKEFDTESGRENYPYVRANQWVGWAKTSEQWYIHDYDVATEIGLCTEFNGRKPALLNINDAQFIEFWKLMYRKEVLK